MTICIGKPIIRILAEHGQWQSEDGEGLIAACELFRNDPYAEIERLRGMVAQDTGTWQDLFYGERAANERLQADKAELLAALHKIASGALDHQACMIAYDAIAKMEGK